MLNKKMVTIDGKDLEIQETVQAAAEVYAYEMLRFNTLSADYCNNSYVKLGNESREVGSINPKHFEEVKSKLEVEIQTAFNEHKQMNVGMKKLMNKMLGFDEENYMVIGTTTKMGQKVIQDAVTKSSESLGEKIDRNKGYTDKIVILSDDIVCSEDINQSSPTKRLYITEEGEKRGIDTIGKVAGRNYKGDCKITDLENGLKENWENDGGLVKIAEMKGQLVNPEFANIEEYFDQVLNADELVKNNLQEVGFNQEL